jgi:hypothetical protein
MYPILRKEVDIQYRKISENQAGITYKDKLIRIATDFSNSKCMEGIE